MDSFHGLCLANTAELLSNDGGLGGTVNPLQAYFFLHLMSRLTGIYPGWIQHTVHDLHIYDTQRESLLEFIDREPLPVTGKLILGDSIGIHTTLEDLEAMDPKDIFTIEGYRSHDKVSIPLTV